MDDRRSVFCFIRLAPPAVFLLALGGLAFATLVRGVFAPGEFAAFGLVVTTVVAATASFFSPCSFTVLPSYLAFAGSGAESRGDHRFRRALGSGLAAALGVVTTVAVLGLIIAALGTGIGGNLAVTASDPTAPAQALRIVIGTFVLSMGLLHNTGQSHRIPLVGRLSSWAIRAQGEGGPSLRSMYGFGAGYVVVGVG